MAELGDMTRDYELLVFDWDGTVMDSAARIVTCIESTIADLGLEPRSREQIRHIIGLSMNRAIETLYPGCDAAFHDRMIEGYRHHYLVADPTPSLPFAGSAETLARLHRSGYLMGVATGKSRRGLDQVLVDTGFGDYFHATRCADEAPSKPHPGMLEQLFDELGVTPGRALVIGDTLFDLEMARNAGADAVAVTYGAHPRERLEEAAPLAYLDDIRDLPPWLGHPAEETR
ncbi:MAG: HAD-IA family hydrolase [Gammaproteobacteria bacterium]|nr:HAD-IA family hydrolase [Gammaproteobacteria bacterium]